MKVAIAPHRYQHLMLLVLNFRCSNRCVVGSHCCFNSLMTYDECLS